MHMVLVPCFNTSTELSALCSIHAVHADTQTQTSTPADSSCAGQHPSGWVLLSPAGSWQMPRLLPVITLDLSQTASLSLFLTLFHPCLSPSSHFFPSDPSFSRLSSLLLRPVGFLFRTLGWTCFPPGFKWPLSAWLGSRGKGTWWVVLMEARGALHSNRLLPYADTPTCYSYPRTHTHTHMSTCKHPLRELCVFNQDLNICPLPGCLP